MVDVFEFFLLFLASFRLTRLMVYDTITAFLRKPFHEIVEETLPDGTTETFLKVKGTGVRYWIGELLSCYWCTGIWSAIFLYIGYIVWPFLFQPLVVILAIAGCAALMEVIAQKMLE
ncbi:uncharacterized protein DUF1360 [Thermolongibacillus altinsuensis]|uniref:Uncharacterized protein DUF1360 n=1 Tax=Thermolongibacillus altinsuensis TaxID=575256 RepID=A0A4R1QF03_9BACL|nr:DUF1360 domain-containing protein [Thermolongibacillus altinsuensis]TCL50984.1 uncharacterized protein DUF1360 [Thermolongibacillus altinsuensis]GMB08946.1 membrane protein [Thermolongibacillus altinsuensis]